MTDSESILRTERLTKKFGAGFVALDDVSMEVDRGTIHGIIGPNGAGKTTFFNLISGLLEPTEGSIYFGQEEITNWSPYQRVQAGIGKVYQVTSVFPELTIAENLLGAHYSTGSSSHPFIRYSDDEEALSKIKEEVDRLELEFDMDTQVSNLSHADQKLVEIAMVLVTSPDLILLDEPTAGLSASETSNITDKVERLGGESTIMIIEHDMDVVMDISDQMTVFHNGRILTMGTPEQISQNEQVQDVYFGRS